MDPEDFYYKDDYDYDFDRNLQDWEDEDGWFDEENE